MKTISFFVLSACLFINANAQCNFTPTVTGDTMLCPDSGGELETQQGFANYAWFKRGLSDSAATPVSTSTTYVLTVNHFDDSAFYFSVEVTDSNGCAERSAEKLVDGWAFLPPVVETTGDYTIGNDGETVICDGDTAFYTLLQPYDTLITWFKDGDEIEGANGATIAVTEAGNYSVEGAPKICPVSIEQIGVTLVAEVINCTNGFHRPLQQVLQWNVTANTLQIKNIPAHIRTLDVEIYALDGRMVKKETLPAEGSAMLQLPVLAQGAYLCKLQLAGETVVKKIVF